MAECKHGLDERWCASCKAPLRTAPRVDDVSHPFAAKYDGWCAACGDEIAAGDRIVMCDGRASHAECGQ